MTPFSPATFASPLAQNYSLIFRVPSNGFYVEGSGLVRLGNALIAVVPVIPRVTGTDQDPIRRVELSMTYIVRSEDGGRTWQQIAEIPRLYSSVPWTHEGKLYLFAFKGGLKFRNDDLLLLRSDDGGVTWSEPVTLFKGHFWNCHTAMTVVDRRLYWAIDDISFGMANRGPCVLAGDLSADVMDPASWRLSDPVPFRGVPPMMTNPAYDDDGPGKHRYTSPSQYLEPNVLNVNGKLRVQATVKFKRQSTTGLCAVFDFEDDGKDIRLTFRQYHPMVGGQLKFGIAWDEPSRMFWATANIPVDSQDAFDWWRKGQEAGYFNQGSGSGNDRRLLMLLYSLDGLNWFQAGCIARAGKISQSFMYPMPLVDGDDLVAISRSSIASGCLHDADCATFHRVKNFRKLAINLFPDPENG